MTAIPGRGHCFTFTVPPLPPPSLSCPSLPACDEMYSAEDQRYACSTGCKTPTIDSTFPNRSHLYTEGNVTSEIDLILPPMEDTFSYFLDSFFLPRNPIIFEDLAEHAQNMEVLVVPYLRSDVTILTNDVIHSSYHILLVLPPSLPPSSLFRTSPLPPSFPSFSTLF